MKIKNVVPSEYGQLIMDSFSKFPVDDIQTFEKENLFMGCHAQWITPESVGEKLPYYDQDRKIVITADAIIDNRPELFEKLSISKALRETMPDSKLILLAYEEWQEESPKYLVGEFAFMIFDERKNKLFGARDFSGSRTLYYSFNQPNFAFSTTIEGLLTLPFVNKSINKYWLAQYLAIPGMNETVDTSLSVINDIKQLPPSHSITINRGKIKLNRYCVITPGKQLKLASNEEYVEAFCEVFDRSVNDRIRTFKQVGAHLSGGLDSGAVASFAAGSLRTTI